MIQENTGQATPDGNSYAFAPLMKEIAEGLSDQGRKTLAKLIDVYHVSQAELNAFRAENEQIQNYEGQVKDGVWHDDRLSMQARELLNIIANGIPKTEAEVEGKEEAPY